MLKQRQKDFLNHLFAIGHGQAQRANVSQQRIPKLRKQTYDFVFQRHWTGYKHPKHSRPT
jgi:hypothetical protein